MAFVLAILLLVIFVAVVASLHTEGMWGNAITLINVATAGLLASNYFEPVADWIEGSGGLKSYTYIWDFLSLWVLFTFFTVVLRAVTDRVSKIKVPFLQIVNQIGSVAFACLVAGVVVCFTAFSLHTAPLSKNFLFGAFRNNTPMILGWSPDKTWLQFTRSVSRGVFSCSPPAVFDPHGQLRARYEARRTEIEANVKANQSIRKN